MLGRRRWPGRPREQICVVGAVGHDFYTGERDGPQGFPRFTDPRLRGPDGYADYLRMATERSLERCGIDSFDLLLLHNPDRIGYTTSAVWEGMAALRERRADPDDRRRPRPRQRLHARPDRLPRALRRADRLGDGHPQPARAVAGRARASTPPRPPDVKVITRVVDYGGLFFDDVLPGQEMAPHDHRGFRPAGWIEAGRERARRDAPDRRARRPDADPARLPVEPRPRRRSRCVVPTLIQEAGPEPARSRTSAPSSPRSRRAAAHRRGRRRDPRDRRQHRLDGAQGREPRPRGRGAARPLGRSTTGSPRSPAAGDRARARPAPRSA